MCPGYTISRAILGDAVALTRGDPYLTVAMTPYNVRISSSQPYKAPNDASSSQAGAISTLRLTRRTARMEVHLYFSS
jgi:hypothetical protein